MLKGIVGVVVVVRSRLGRTIVQSQGKFCRQRWRRQQGCNLRCQSQSSQSLKQALCRTVIHDYVDTRLTGDVERTKYYVDWGCRKDEEL